MSGASPSLRELIDIDELQSIQDSFARAAGISSVVFSAEGEPLTGLTNLTGFCSLIQSTEKGRERCFQSFMEMGEIALRSETPESLYCFAHGGHFVAPIIIDGEHKGTVVAGQFIPDKFSSEQLEELEKIALEIDLDPGLLVKEAGKMRVVGEDAIRNYSSLLFNIVEAIARGGVQAAELIRAKDALQRAHDELERRVEERIVELAEANKGLKHEIAERKLAEETLQESAEKFGNLAEESPNMIFINQRGRVVYANKKCKELMGYEREEFYSPDFDFLCLISPESKDLVKECFSRQSMGEEVAPYEYALISKAGERIDVILTSKLISYEGETAILGIMTDVTEQKRIGGALKDRVEFEEIVTTISTSFINLAPDEINIEIGRALGSIGEFSGVDRGYLFRLSDDKTKTDNTHEWCAEGIVPQIENLKGLPTADFPWLMERLNRFETVHIPSVADLPPDADAIKETLQAQDILSVILVPMVYGGTLVGYIGFDSVRQEKRWSEDNIALLKVVGAIFVNALERRKVVLERRNILLERKRVTATLQESEEKHRSIIENIQEVFYRTDIKGNLVMMSPSGAKLLGYDSVEEMMGLNVTKTFYAVPEERGEFLTVLEEKGVVNDYEITLKKTDGTLVPVWASSHFYFDKSGNPLGMEGLLSDITERKRAEREIENLQRYNRGLIESNLDPLATFDREGIIMDVNRAMTHAAGRTREELVGTPFADYFTDPDRAYKGAMLTFESGEVRDYELVMKAKDGTETIFSYNVHLYRDPAGKVAGAFAAARDITSRRAAEEELKKKQSAEEAYADLLTVTSRTIDLNTIVTESLSNLMKYTDSPLGVIYLYNHDLGTLLPVAVGGAGGAVAEQAFLYGEGIPGETAAKKEMTVATDLEDAIYKIPSGDGMVPPDTIISMPIIFKSTLLGVVLTCHTTSATLDLTDFIKRVTDQIAVAINNANTYTEIQEMAAELKSERDKLEMTSRELVAVSKTKSEFLANMSHELRTPLNSIIGFSEILHDEMFGPLNEKQAKYINNVLISGKHLLKLINDILDLSKVEAGKVELVCEDFSASDAINEVRTLTGSIAAKKSIVLDVSVDEDLTTIHADEGKFKQILYNLLSNAIKFTPESGSVTVHARCHGDMAEISVTDTGIGISEENQKKLFQPFMQADTSTSREYGGTGLGLSLVRKFTELHGGTVWIESEPGKGSTFTFTIPIAGRVEAETEATEEDMLEEEVAAGAKMPEQLREVPEVAEIMTAEKIATIEMPEIIEPAGGSGDEPLILVVEDDENSSKLLILTLTDAGYKVMPAYNGIEALAVAKRLKPFAITLDIMMPGMDGWDVLKYLKYDSETSDIPVIVISMLDEGEIGLLLGAADYFVKPVEKNALIAVLNNLEDALDRETEDGS